MQRRVFKSKKIEEKTGGRGGGRRRKERNEEEEEGGEASEGEGNGSGKVGVGRKEGREKKELVKCEIKKEEERNEA